MAGCLGNFEDETCRLAERPDPAQDKNRYMRGSNSGPTKVSTCHHPLDYTSGLGIQNKCKETFKKYHLPDELGNGRINAVSNLLNSNFGIVLASSEKLGITVCKGKFYCYLPLSMSNHSRITFLVLAKTGGKRGMHSWVPTISIITAASYIAIQVYEHHFGLQFYEKPPSHTFPQLKCFDMIPASHFLCTLKHLPANSDTGLRISTEDFNVFKLLKARLPSITRAISDLNKRKKSTPAPEPAGVELEDE